MFVCVYVCVCACAYVCTHAHTYIWRPEDHQGPSSMLARLFLVCFFTAWISVLCAHNLMFFLFLFNSSLGLCISRNHFCFLLPWISIWLQWGGITSWTFRRWAGYKERFCEWEYNVKKEAAENSPSVRLARVATDKDSISTLC